VHEEQLVDPVADHEGGERHDEQQRDARAEDDAHE
jgi:hypothetical protein